MLNGMDAGSAGSQRSLPSYQVVPAVGIGPVRLGMSRAQARQAMEASGMTVTGWERHPRLPEQLHGHGSSFQVRFDETDAVTEMVAAGAPADSQALGLGPEIGVIYRGVDLLGEAATEVIAVVSTHASADENDEDFPLTVTFPTLGLTLWRSEDVPRFESVMLQRPPPA